MELTDEQKERIRKNRERALEIQKQKKQINGTVAATTTNIIASNPIATTSTTAGAAAANNNKRSIEECDGSSSNTDEKNKRPSNNNNTDNNDKNDYSNNSSKADEIEAFEEGASEYVTRQEAMKVYCLPQGTLDVCQYIERTNPKNNAWNTMKLYYRNEIRQRAHKRYGGINGLIKERNKRSQNKLLNDIEKSKNIFK